MKERPIIFSSDMVMAILNGRKTQTRRVVSLRNSDFYEDKHVNYNADITGTLNHGDLFWTFYLGWKVCGISKHDAVTIKCPYGIPGDRLWVREAFSPRYFDDGNPGYKADWTKTAAEYCKEPKWKPSIHMPRQLSRITLEIVNIRVERVQIINEENAIAEGIIRNGYQAFFYSGMWDHFRKTAKEAYSELWEMINAKRGFGWDANPWVWVIEFKRIEEEGNHD